MLSVCDGCWEIFPGQLNRFNLKQLQPGICKLTEQESFECINPKCRYFIDEDDSEGCNEFLFCSNCLKDKEIVNRVIDDFKENV